MFRDFSDYTIQIEDVAYETPAGVKCSRSALLNFLDSGSKTLGSLRLGVVKPAQIFSWIDTGIPVVLDHCLVEGFSLAEYRRGRRLNPEVEVLFKNFSAQNAVFLSRAVIDFSYTLFRGETLSFKQALFLAPQVSFRFARLEVQNLCFEKTLFRNELSDFCYLKSKAVNFSFKDAMFSAGKKLFEHAELAKGKMIFTNTDFNEGETSFAYAHFGDGLVNYRFARFGNGRVSFYKSHFGFGEKNFEGVDFGDGEFNFRSAFLEEGKLNMTRAKFGVGDKNFTNTEFGDGTVSFVNTNFGQGNITFKLAVFGAGKKDFHFSSINGDIIFERCHIGKGGVDFRAAELKNGKLSFTRTEIQKGELNFDGTVLTDMRLMFKYTVFESNKLNFHSVKALSSYILFDNSQLNGSSIVFLRASIGVLNMHACHLDSYIDLRVNICEAIDLSSTIVRDIIDMMPGETAVQIKALNFSNMRLIGKIYVDWQKNQLKKLIYQQASPHEERAYQFRLLKENFNSIGSYADEDLAYVEFKREEAKALRDEGSINWCSRFYHSVVYYFKWFLFDKVGLYATDPVRVLISMLITFLFFTVSYELLSLSGKTGIVSSLGDPDHLSLWERSFYHSSITFLTIGYGDYYPSGIIRWISSLEGFAGLFLMSYFTVAFVRKILR